MSEQISWNTEALNRVVMLASMDLHAIASDLAAIRLLLERSSNESNLRLHRGLDLPVVP